MTHTTQPKLERVKPASQTSKNPIPATIPPLETSFSKNGWHFRQIFREGLIAVYARSKPECLHYEVIKINVNEPREAFGKHLDASESFPSENSWGTNGFTILNKQEALDRANKWINDLNKNID